MKFLLTLLIALGATLTVSLPSFADTPPVYRFYVPLPIADVVARVSPDKKAVKKVRTKKVRVKKETAQACSALTVIEIANKKECRKNLRASVGFKG